MIKNVILFYFILNIILNKNGFIYRVYNISFWEFGCLKENSRLKIASEK
jgi:hypothetical protein